MSKIEWTERSWNPIIGCAIVSPGCTNCYAMRMAHRLGQNPMTPAYADLTRVVNDKPVWTGEVRLAGHDAITAPMKRRTPTIWFVNSMSDLFADGMEDSWIDAVFAVMALTPQHTYQVLTKRPERMQDYVRGITLERLSKAFAPGALRMSRNDVYRAFGLAEKFSYDPPTPRLPLPNVWLGVSAEDQRRANERIPILLDTPAQTRFVSIEPMLGQISLVSDLGGIQWMGGQRGCGGMHVGTGAPGCPRTPHHHHDARCRPGLDWVIVGGESGPGARPMHPDWARLLRNECSAAGVPFFFKQWGEWAAHIDRDVDDDDWRADYGRMETGRYCWLNLAGRTGFHGDRFHVMRRVGKKAAGRLLDGVLHDGMPG